MGIASLAVIKKGAIANTFIAPNFALPKTDLELSFRVYLVFKFIWRVRPSITKTTTANNNCITYIDLTCAQSHLLSTRDGAPSPGMDLELATGTVYKLNK
ncbi:hypothetical protein NQ317_004935 [Molorchus minor]|uniref:Uncharacterized protein n=1 Tax=Molorchus minor TaxID=1323400 RepID=A0ABQ9JWT6_9CUCU|nr:hypothetical protein NQ317_004935 [Molorchus minor]